MDNNQINSGATFGKDRKHRFALWRIWDPSKPLIMFIGLNPSTANETSDDNTIRRVKSMAEGWGYGGVYMCNCFPYISTNPKLLDCQSELPTNDSYLIQIGEKCEEIVFAWGNFEEVTKHGRDKHMLTLFPHAKCLVKNKSGSPKHPLYVKGDTKLIPFDDTSYLASMGNFGLFIPHGAVTYSETTKESYDGTRK